MPSSKYLTNFPDSVLFTWFEGAEAFFNESKLYLQYPWTNQGVYRPGQQIRIHKEAVSEPFTSHPQNRVLSMGAFSYCRTPQISHDFQLGRYCSVASGVQLSDGEHPMDRISTHPFTTHPHMIDLARREFGKDVKIVGHEFSGPAPVIGNDVWIGQGALIKRGVTVGDGAVIGARALVTKDVPPYAVVGGSPARILKYRIEDEALRERFLRVRWWDYNYADFPQHDPRDRSGFLDALEESIDSGTIQRFNPAPIPVVDALCEFLDHEVPAA